MYSLNENKLSRFFWQFFPFKKSSKITIFLMILFQFFFFEKPKFYRKKYFDEFFAIFIFSQINEKKSDIYLHMIIQLIFIQTKRKEQNIVNGDNSIQSISVIRSRLQQMFLDFLHTFQNSLSNMNPTLKSQMWSFQGFQIFWQRTLKWTSGDCWQ